MESVQKQDLTYLHKIQLESMLDDMGLVATIEALSAICYDKVAHLSESWQETSSDQVKTWKHNASYLDKVSPHVWRQSWER